MPLDDVLSQLYLNKTGKKMYLSLLENIKKKFKKLFWLRCITFLKTKIRVDNNAEAKL